MSRTQNLVILIFAFLTAAPALAVDLQLKASMVQSQITTPDSSQPFKISGFAPSVMWLYDSSTRVSAGLLVQPMINLDEDEVSRNAVEAVAYLSLFGQARKSVEEYQGAQLTKWGSWALYAIGQFGIHLYHASVEGVEEKIKGSMLQTQGGLGLRFDIGQAFSVGLEGVQTIVSFSNSTEKITASETQGGAYFRIDLD